VREKRQISDIKKFQIIYVDMSPLLMCGLCSDFQGVQNEEGEKKDGFTVERADKPCLTITGKS
jgi:hypothetical protein